MIRIEVKPQDAIDGFHSAADTAPGAVARAVYAAGALLQGNVRARARNGVRDGASGFRTFSDAPNVGLEVPFSAGPSMRTGNYIRSIVLQTGMQGGSPVAVVGSNAPQAARLEYGFTGPDSLGRTFRKTPYPHWRPAIRATEGKVLDLILDALEAL